MKLKDILSAVNSRLGIDSLNKMQSNMLDTAAASRGDIVLLSPTGSGKTLAFLIPLIKELQPAGRLQAVVIAPSRELVMQIADIARKIAGDCRITACYGGHNAADEKASLQVEPDIIIATPGRLLDHINRKNVDVYRTRFLVLDEFDKSLQLGFTDEMERIIRRMPNLKRRFLTSATAIDEIPDFVRISSPVTIRHEEAETELRTRLDILKVVSPQRDKLDTLLLLLANLQDNSRSIVFVNHRDAAARVYDFLLQNGVPAGIYHGGMEQNEREKAIAMFNNGSFLVLVSTDLGSRGLDIAEVKHIIHYHLPVDAAAFTHRNGRTARIDASGAVHVIVAADEHIPEYMAFDSDESLDSDAKMDLNAPCATLYFKAGKKEKISKGDIVGFLVNNASLQGGEIGAINCYDHYSLVAVPRNKAKATIKAVEGKKIKNQKVKISLAIQQVE